MVDGDLCQITTPDAAVFLPFQTLQFDNADQASHIFVQHAVAKHVFAAQTLLLAVCYNLLKWRSAI